MARQVRYFTYPFLLACSFAIAIAGCATSPSPDAFVSVVPAERTFPAASARPTEGGGSIAVKRDAGLMGSACSARVWIDGQPVADLRQSERITVHVDAGEHIVSAQPNGICAGGLVEGQAAVKPGRTARFRIGYGTNGDFLIAPTAF